MSGGWDCHAHLFGPYDRFPLAADRSYTPPEALDVDYLILLDRLALAHGVLVHPSAYGDDFGLLFDALSRHDRLRGVVVVRPDTSATLSDMQGLGVRAARFSHRSGSTNFAGSATFDDLITMAPRLADAGLHAELWTDCTALIDIASRLETLPLPVVIDHMGGFDPRAGIDDPGFQALLSLVASGKVWIKLCVYRNLLGVEDFEVGRPFHEALITANPDRMLWGTDWPHLRVTPVPDAGQLLDVMKRWTGNEATLSKILEANPSALYD